MATKEKSDLVINRGKHLTTCLNNRTGEFKMTWDWDALLAEVAALSVPKIDLVKETEAKVTKTRTKKVVKDQITDAVTAKKPAAKKPAAKKPATKKK